MIKLSEINSHNVRRVYRRALEISLFPNGKGEDAYELRIADGKLYQGKRGITEALEAQSGRIEGSQVLVVFHVRNRGRIFLDRIAKLRSDAKRETEFADLNLVEPSSKIGTVIVDCEGGSLKRFIVKSKTYRRAGDVLDFFKGSEVAAVVIVVIGSGKMPESLEGLVTGLENAKFKVINATRKLVPRDGEK